MTGRHETSARRQLLFVVVIGLSVSALTTVLVGLPNGGAKFLQHLVRFALTAMLCIFLWKRQRWARWTAAGLFLLAGVVGVLGSAVFWVFSGGLPLILPVAVGIAHLACFAILAISEPVSEYFRRGRHD